jgi:hypothetical protein
MADELYVYAKVPAVMPTEPAIITSPKDGSSVSKSSVIVEGICPDITPHVVIVITVDGAFGGSDACDDDNHFSVPIVVAPGTHTLIAQMYTITDDRGPDSEPVTFVYALPAPIQSSEAIAAQNAEQGKTTPLVVTIDEPFIVFGPGKDAIWTGSITGGRLPYRVYINWGDGTANTYQLKQSGGQHFAHHYRSMQAHRILMRVTDPDGRGVTQVYAAVTPYVPPTAGLLGSAPRNPFSGSAPIGIYGIYLILLAIFGYLWVRAHPSYAYAKVTTAQATVKRHYAAAKHRRRKASAH